MRRDPLSFFTGLARKYGDVAGLRLGTERVVLLVHPEHIKDVLVTDARNFMKGRGLERAKRLLGEGLLTSEGEVHLRQRRLVQPAFHRQRIAGYAAVMTRYAQERPARWRDGVTLDLHREMVALTLAVVGKTLFGAEVESEAAEIGEALAASMALFDTAMLPFTELLDRLPLPWNQQFKRARARLDATIYRLIGERRASGEDRGDLLSMLLLARDVEGDGTRMTDLQLRDEAMTIFLAGHETTANALTWTWYLLAQHPAVEAKLHAEVDAVLGAGRPNASDLGRLSYTRQVLAESMRLYPPAWIIGRRALAEYQVAGYALPARSIVLLSPYVTHHDERFFPDPCAFNPDRWTPEAQAARPRFAYFPFGGGPRNCIGEQFAWMEGILVLATIAQRWQFRLAPGQNIRPYASVTLRPAYGMQMTVHRRRRTASVGDRQAATPELGGAIR